MAMQIQKRPAVHRPLRGHALGTQKTFEHRVQRATRVINATSGGYLALAWFAFLVTKRLYELRVSVAPGAGEFDEHAKSVVNSKHIANTYNEHYCHYTKI